MRADYVDIEWHRVDGRSLAADTVDGGVIRADLDNPLVADDFTGKYADEHDEIEKYHATMYYSTIKNNPDN